jgi:hypothetical protein
MREIEKGKFKTHDPSSQSNQSPEYLYMPNVMQPPKESAIARNKHRSHISSISIVQAHTSETTETGSNLSARKSMTALTFIPET